MSLLKNDFLIAGRGSEQQANGWLATTSEPWLIFRSTDLITRHRWVRLRYSSSFLDEPIRPLIRFTTADGEKFTEPMNGPVLGSAEWIGRVPEQTVEVAISPARRVGPFNFRVDSIEGEWTARLLLRGALRSRLWTYWTLRCLFVGSRREAWQALRSATEGTDYRAYSQWHAKNVRQPDFSGFDASRVGEVSDRRFVIVLIIGQALRETIHRTLKSLTEQSHRRYLIAAVFDEGTPQSALDELATVDPVEIINTNQDWQRLGLSIAPGDWISVVDAGDELRPHALALIAESLVQFSNAGAIYADEDCVSADGKLHTPILKPDWSPAYQAHSNFVGRALFIDALRIPRDIWRSKPVTRALMAESLSSIPSGEIHHVRRVLYSRADPLLPKNEVAAPKISLGTTEWPAVSVIVPTRDKARLLSTCLESLWQKTTYSDIDVVVVDNGSKTPDALALLDHLADDGRIRVIRSPGTFNFSKLCNVGAAACTSPILLFLNNDTEVAGNPGWLKALVSWALQPQVGAVGARLSFADGRIQHAGIVLGLSGIAGHPYLRLRDAPHRIGRLDEPHEVSAVTGACLAVARAKFDAVGGFDEELAIDLNDVDLCLRLSEKGWGCIWTPEAKLVHHESSSRGIARNYFEAYEREIARFTRRWAHIIRDDPFFHPAFSLYAYDVRLG